MKIQKKKLFAILLATIIVATNCSTKNEEAQSQEQTEQEAAPASNDGRPTPLLVEVEIKDTDYSLGNTDAPVTIVEFSDFECPSCADFYALIESLKEDYIETGKLRFVYKHFPLEGHPQGVKSAVAARCAGKEDKFWEMYDILFQNQGSFSKVFYTEKAEELGLDASAFKKCLDDPFVMRDVNIDKNEGKKMGITGTPTFIINGELYSGVPPRETLAEMIDEKIGD